MVTKFTLFFLLLFGAKAYAGINTFVPDSIFRNYIASLSPAAIVGDSMNIDDPIISTIDSINITGLGIYDLEGIQYFDSLRTLEASHNNITNVVRLPFRLRGKVDARANMSYNPLGHIGGGTNSGLLGIYNLNVSHCQLTGYFTYNDATKWIHLDISYNQVIGYVDFNPSILQYLDCSHNNLQEMGFSPNECQFLTYLDCSYNIISLGTRIKFGPALEYLNCSHNLLTSLPVLPVNLPTLNCSNNFLSNMPVLNAKLWSLNIDSNLLIKIDSLPANLNNLTCKNNSLVSIGSLPDGLQSLDCRYNNLLCLPELPSFFIELQASHNFVNCLPNLPGTFLFTSDIGYNGTGYDVCTSQHCTDLAKISGYAFMDLDSNGTWDSGEPPLVNHIIALSPLPQLTMTDNAGYYTFNVQPGLLYTVKPRSRLHSASKPDSVNVLLPLPFADTSNVNFAFSFTATIYSDVAIYATQVIPAVPGQTTQFHLSITNRGTRTESGKVFFAVDPLFTYQNSVPPASIINDTLVWDFSNLDPGVSISYVINMAVKESDIVGTPFGEVAIVNIVNNDTFPDNNIAEVNSWIVSIYPPNTKTVWPEIYNSANYAAGDYFDYTIRFQNTTDGTVANVRIEDTLSLYFDMRTLEIVSGSHDYRVTINGNKLTVYFDDINLPDSASDPLRSHGFFRFKIRPYKLSFTGTIRNKAYIYFNGKPFDGGRCETSVCLSGEMTIGTTATPVTKPDCTPVIPGTAKVVVYNGALPYTFLWSNGGANSTNFNLTMGDYYVTVTDACEKVAIGMAYVDSVSKVKLNAAISGTQIKCPGTNDGSATVSTCGGYLPVRYSWSNGATTASITGLKAGTYTCYVMDSAGFQVVVDILISEPRPLSLAFSGSGCSSAVGFASVVVNGGTSPYYYAWGNGGATNRIDSVGNGIYSCTVTDANGCTTEGSRQALSATRFNFNVGYLQGNTPCSNGYVSYDITTKGPDYYFKLDYQYPIIAKNYSQVSWGYHTITVSYGPNNQCPVDTHFTTPRPLDPPQVQVYAVNDISCPGGSDGILGAFASGQFSGGYRYYWGDGNEGETDSALSAGEYYCTVYDSNQCYATGHYTLEEPPPMQIDDTVAQVSCGSNSDGYVGVFAFTHYGRYIQDYKWSNGKFGGEQRYLSPGTYICTITDYSNCTTSVSYTINPPQPSTLVVTDSITHIKCNGDSSGSVRLFATSDHTPFSFRWGNNNTSGTLTGLNAATYYCTVTDALGCRVTRGYNVTQPAVLTIFTDSVRNVSCFEKDNGYISLAPGGGKTPYTYQWTNGAVSNTNTLLSAAAYSCSVSDANGCLLVKSYSITEPEPLVIADSVKPATCFGYDDGYIHLTATGGNAPYTYNWNKNNMHTGMNDSLVAGNYSCTIIDTKGCSNTHSYSITQPLPITIADSIVHVKCYGDSDGTVQLVMADVQSGFSFHWSDSSSGSSISGIPASTYSCIITDSSGCFVTNSYTVLQPALLSIQTDSISNISCYGNHDGYISLSAAGGTGPYRYSWDSSLALHYRSQLAMGSYSCSITDANGCRQEVTFEIIDPDSLTAGLSASNEALCGLSDGEILVDSISGGTSPYLLRWSNGDTTRHNQNLAAGSYLLTITDSRGCTTVFSSSLTCDIATGFSNDPEDEAWRINPNPATSYIRIEELREGNYTLVLWDITGREIRRLVIHGSIILNMADLAKGAYLIDISDSLSHKRRIEKLILD